MKFKNIKRKKYKKKSPSNSRNIPASAKASAGKPEYFRFSFPKINHTTLLEIYGGALKIFVALIFVIAAVIVGFDLQNNLQTKDRIDSQRKAIVSDLNFWENFMSKNQNYRDAYFQASILEYKLGNISKAKMYAEKGLSLDPNSQDGEKLQKFLTNKSSTF